MTDADKKLAKLWPWELKVGDWCWWHDARVFKTGTMCVIGEAFRNKRNVSLRTVDGGSYSRVLTSDCIPRRTSDQIFAKLIETNASVILRIDLDQASAEWEWFPPDTDGIVEGVEEGVGEDCAREALAATLVKVLKAKNE